mgnify:CR=1 FL=1
MMIVSLNKSGKHQRFVQYLESQWVDVCLPLYYYSSNDSFEVFSYVCDMIEGEF